VVERFQQAALESARYFENVRRYAGFEPVQFAFNLLTRSGRITHLELTRRDPAFVVAVDSWFAASATAGTAPHRDRMIVAPPPMLTLLRLRSGNVTNRVAMSPAGDDSATQGLPMESEQHQLAEAATSGAGLVLTQLVAVSPRARITPGTPGLYHQDHTDVWRETVARIHRDTTTKLMLRLGHAGPRGATRQRREGVDRPLQRDGWPLLAASPIPYTPSSQTPTEAGPEDMRVVTEDFAAAAHRAEDAGFDGILLDFSQGYLVASFISPLTNHRGDAYGGPLEARLRFPLQVFDAVRAAWPQDRPLGVSLTATDWARGGLGPDEAVFVARVLKERGCDLVRVLAGQTTWRSRPEYGPMFLVPFSDRVRNEAGVATMVGGGITTYDQVDTILAAGRADLCVLDVPAS
jgi:anthraniloyl-CoA monooxygenase